MRFSRLPAVCAGVLLLTIYLRAADDQSGKGLSAREVFYSAEQTTVTPGKAAAGAPAAAPHHVVVKPSKKVLAPTSSAKDQSAAATSGSADAGQVQTATSATPDTPPRSTSSNSGGAARLSNVSNHSYPPLGMKYSVSRVLGENRKEPADSDSVFHSNDHIEVNVEVNAPGYLYILTRGASGRWSTLFPESSAEQSAGLVEPHHSYTVPPGGVITFAEPAGKEQLFLFLSRQPVRSAEDLMLQISNGGTQQAAPQKSNFDHYDAVEAFNRMDDSGIQNLQKAYSRDLIVEKTHGEAAPAAASNLPDKDTSVYVVDPSGKQDAHVVAEISLRHE